MIETTLNGKTKDIVQDNIEQLKQLFPEIITEDKINFDKLREILGEEIDDTIERYNFTWKGKHETTKIALTPSEGTLRPDKESSKNWDNTENLYIEGDNLEVLKLLQKSYYGKIRLIYLDPPYNTGNDFIYNDDFTDNLKNYLELDENGFNISSNPETSGRYHTNWLNMIYPRLKLARTLLSENGLIIISIDEKEVENLKKICNEIFGEYNLLSNIIWQSRTSISNDQAVSLNHNHTLIYCKNIEKCEYGGEPLDIKDYDNPDNDIRGPWKLVPIDANKAGGNTRYPIINPKTKKEYYPPNNRIWAYNPEEYMRLFNDGRIKFGKNDDSSPKKKIYYYERIEKGDRKTPSSILTNAGTTKNGTTEIMKLFNNKKVFNYPKPSTLIMKLINYGMLNFNENDIVMDFFSGSATTADAVMKKNLESQGHLKFIMIQIPEPCSSKTIAFEEGYSNICELGEERIRRAGDKLLEENPDADIDIGFKVFKLDSSNLTKWNPNIDNLEDSLVSARDNIVEGRSKLDLVYEIMLKYGLELTLPIEEIKTDNYNFYSVGLGSLVICLDNHIKRDIAEDIIKIKKDLNPSVMRVVFKDNGFERDSDKTNVKEILRNNEVDEFITI